MNKNTNIRVYAQKCYKNATVLKKTVLNLENL